MTVIYIVAALIVIAVWACLIAWADSVAKRDARKTANEIMQLIEKARGGK